MAKDPMCGIDVDEATAKKRVQQDGQTYFFCAPGCKNAFEPDPQKYRAPDGEARIRRMR